MIEAELKTHYTQVRHRLFNSGRRGLPKPSDRSEWKPLVPKPIRVAPQNIRPCNAHVIAFHGYMLAQERGEPYYRRVEEIGLDIIQDFPQYSWSDIISKRRSYALVNVRAAIVDAIIREKPTSLPRLGRRMNRDHTSILHLRNVMIAARADGTATCHYSPTGTQYWMRAARRAKGAAQAEKESA